MNQLRRDMATLINYARAFQRYPAGGNEVSHSDTTPDCYDINDTYKWLYIANYIAER